jgi:hypothetical protein
LEARRSRAQRRRRGGRSRRKAITNRSADAEFYQPGPCPLLGPKFSVDSLKLYNANTHRWELAAPQMDGKTTSVNPFAQSNCFNNDATGNATYFFFLETPNDEWEVATAQR